MIFLVKMGLEMRAFIAINIFMISTLVNASACFNKVSAKHSVPWNGQVETIVESYLNTFKIPGVVVLVGNSKGVIYEKAFGKRSLDKEDTNTLDTIYDLASITKLFTASAVMKLVEDKKVYLGGKVKRYFPENYVTAKKQLITVEDLMRHNSGFKAGVSYRVFTDNLDTTWDNILNIEPNYPYRSFKYSDINYLVLGKLVERRSKQDLNDYIRKNFLEPLAMSDSGFKAFEDSVCKYRCAPTRKKMNRGHVHDPTSFRLGGVAGHAGLFSTAKNLANFASVFMNNGKYCGKKILDPRTIKKMITKRPGENRGLGFDITSPYSVKPRGDYFAKGLSFGHTGFTGVSLWIDPTIDTFLIILSNTVYADNEKFAKSGYLKLITELANIVGEANSI